MSYAHDPELDKFVRSGMGVTRLLHRLDEARINVMDAEVDEVLGRQSRVTFFGKILDLTGVDVKDAELHQLVGVEFLEPELAHFLDEIRRYLMNSERKELIDA